MTPRHESGDARESELAFEQLKAEYELSLRSIVQGQAKSANDIARNHQHHIQAWLNGEQPREFVAILRDPQVATDDNLRTTTEYIADDMASFHDRFVRVIPPEDQQLWEKVQRDAKRMGPTSFSVTTSLGAASSRESGEAMRAALDKIIWEKVQRDAKRMGPTSFSVTTSLGAASSRESGEAMRRQLGGSYDEGSSRSEDYDSFDYEDFFKDAFRGGTFREAFEEEARRRRAGQQRQQHTAGGQQHQTRREAPPKTSLDVEAAQIIQKVVSSDRQAGWLAGADRADIKRVISTVRTIRRKAAEKGEEITDRHIYLRYRRLLERDDVNPQTEESFKILAAMMGNNPKGTLPF
jgi:hypothetical protein